MKRLSSKVNLKIIFLVVLFFGLLKPVNSEPVIPGVETKEPQYAPGQLIVKLKEGKSLEDLKELNEKYKVVSVETIYKKEAASPEETLKQLKDKLTKLNTEHQKWYWQLDKDSKEYKEYIAKIEKEKEELKARIKTQEEFIAHLEQRKKRAPEGATASNLENIYLLKTEEKEINILLMASDYKTNPAVEYAEPNYIATIQMVPNDTLYSQQWAHKKTQAEAGWDIERGNTSVMIAIVDSGVDYNHEDLSANIWKDTQGNPGKDFVDIDTVSYINKGYKLITGEDYTEIDDDPIDYLGHGTHCAGIAGAVTNNGLGVAGVCHNCKLMPLRAGFSIVDPENNTAGILEDDDIFAAIIYATDYGADIISMSFGGQESQQVKDAVDYAYSQGVILIASAGNSKSAQKSYPAGYENVRAVAATAIDDTPASYTNFGQWVDVAAPGGDIAKDSMIISTVPKTGVLSSPTGYKAIQGTSMACPYVAGLTGLCLSRYLDATDKDIIGRIISTTDTLPQDPNHRYLGTGRVNVLNALTAQEEPFLQLLDFKLEEQEGDNDQIPESNEKIKLIITLKNLWKDTYFVDTEVSTTSEFISSIPQSCSNFGNLLQDEVKDNSHNPFVFQIGSIDYDTPVEFLLTTNADNVIQTYRIEVFLGIRRITTDEAKPSGYHPISISGNKIVWTDYRNGYPDIYMFDLETNQERQITTNPSVQWQAAISGNKVVWEDYRNGVLYPGHYTNPDIYLYDLETNQEQQITSSTIYQFYPGISGNKIVWHQVAPGSTNFDIYLYDLDTKEEKRITTANYDQRNARVSGNKIVWNDTRSGNWDIYLYDLDTGQEKLITNNPSQQGGPDISGNKIVWSDLRNGGYPHYDIYMFDLDIDQERQITFDPSGQSEPAIDGNKIVWKDGRSGKYHIYLYDLDTNQEKQITKYSSLDSLCQRYPDISGNKIVWFDYRKGRADIYLAELTDFTPPLTPVVTQPEYLKLFRISYLEASWSSNDPESSIVEYQYRITQDSTTGTIIKDWTSTGTQTSVVVTGITLLPEKTYYFSVKAKNSAGLWSAEGSSNHGTTIDVSSPVIVNKTQSPQCNTSTLRFQAQVTDSLSGVRRVTLGRRISEPPYESFSDISYNLQTGLYEVELSNISETTITYRIHAEDKVENHATSDWFILETNDTTPSGTPIVTDGGQYTTNTTTLTATWSSSDPESGIAEYQYQILQDALTSTTGTLIRDWTSTGTTPSVTATGLTLTTGKTYYFGVKARNGVGLWSEIGYSDGITVDTAKPVITNKTVSPQKVGQPLVYKAQASDTTSGIKKVNLLIKQADGTFAASGALTYNATTGLYEITKPAKTSPKTITYKIKAVDNAGNIKKTVAYALNVVQ